jgi:hypothetical protein
MSSDKQTDVKLVDAFEIFFWNTAQGLLTESFLKTDTIRLEFRVNLHQTLWSISNTPVSYSAGFWFKFDPKTG